MSNKEIFRLNSENNPSFTKIDKKPYESESSQKKLEYLENLIEMTTKFNSTRNLFDLKLFLKENYQKFSNLIDEIYENKESYEYEKLKCAYLEKKVTTISQQNKQEETVNPQELEIKLKKLQDLEKKVESLLKELEEQKSKNEKMKELVTKKDFFREYDYMCKEVEGLRKQNFNLTETIKKIQKQQSPENEENEEDERGMTPLRFK